MKKKVIIMGAAGRDFHNFNVFFRDNEEYEVVAFTATQIPNMKAGSTLQNWQALFIQMVSTFIQSLSWMSLLRNSMWTW